MQSDADDSQLSDEERAVIAKSFNDKSEPKKVISEGIKVNGVKYMTIESSEDALKAKKVRSQGTARRGEY